MKIPKLLICATLAIALAIPAMAATPTFTGDVEADFTGPGYLTFADPGGQDVLVPGHPSAPISSGWDIKDLRVAYDDVSDTLYVGINSEQTVGDADTDGAEGGQTYLSGGGVDVADLGPGESVAVYFDLDQDGDWDVIAGVPSAANFSTGFTVAASSGPTFVPGNFGAPLLANNGGAFWTPATKPDFEIAILDFSTLSGQDGVLGAFDIGAFMGSVADVSLIEDTMFASNSAGDARISIVQSGTNAAGTPHNFTVTVEQNDGTGWVAAAGVSVTGSTDFGTITSTNPAVTNGLGQMTITVNSAIPGTATVDASASVTVNGFPIDVATDGYGALVVDNQKTWVDARISIEESATNQVNDDHSFTVTVEQNDGTGWVAAVGVSVTGSTNFGTITSTNPAVTNGLGQMTITVNSAIPGTATVHASGTVTVSSVPIAVATNGYGALVVHNLKTWVDARISIVETDTNPVGTPHNFTVTVEQNDGAGWDPAVGVSVTGSTDFGTITSTNPDVTNASGQMTITVNSAIPGTATVHASGTVTVSGVPIAVATDGYGAYIVHNQKTWIERPNAFCSFTQGAYGNAGGKDCGDMSTTEVIMALIGQANAGVNGTNPVIVGDPPANGITLYTASCIISTLPAGGKPGEIKPAGNYICNVAGSNLAPLLSKQGRFKNVLIGQVVTLTLNLRLHGIPCLGGDTADTADDDGDLGSYEFGLDEYICVQKGEDGCIERHFVPEGLRELTPSEVLALANDALADDEGLDIGAIYDAVTFINELFDECKTIVDCPVDPVEICGDDCDNDFDGTVDEDECTPPQT